MCSGRGAQAFQCRTVSRFATERTTKASRASAARAHANFLDTQVSGSKFLKIFLFSKIVVGQRPNTLRTHLTQFWAPDDAVLIPIGSRHCTGAWDVKFLGLEVGVWMRWLLKEAGRKRFRKDPQTGHVMRKKKGPGAVARRRGRRGRRRRRGRHRRRGWRAEPQPVPAARARAR